MQCCVLISWVAYALQVHTFGFVINKLLELFRLVTLHEFCGYTQSRECHLELVVCSSVEIRCRYDVVAGVSQRCNGHQLGGLARGGCNGSYSAFQGCDSFLKDIDSGVHDATVYVAKLLEAEKAGAMGAVVEHIAGGGIDRDRASICSWVWFLSVYKNQSLV